MDITRPRVWRICGWAATALTGGIVMLIFQLVHSDKGLHARYAPLLPVMAVTWALLVGIRLFAPPVAKIRQEIELNLGLQRRILNTDEHEPGPPNLRLVCDPEASGTADGRHSSAG